MDGGSSVFAGAKKLSVHPEHKKSSDKRCFHHEFFVAIAI